MSVWIRQTELKDLVSVNFSFTVLMNIMIVIILSTSQYLSSKVFRWFGPRGDSKEAAHIFGLFSAWHNRWWGLCGITQQVLHLRAEETKFACVIVQGQTIGNMAGWNGEEAIESEGRSHKNVVTLASNKLKRQKLIWIGVYPCVYKEHYYHHVQSNFFKFILPKTFQPTPNHYWQ